MERTSELKSNLLVNLIDSYPLVRNRQTFKTYPQMPKNQIQHYVTKASHGEYHVAVQLNASSFTKELSEVVGTLKVSPKTSHVILKTDASNTVHLIQPEYIRHIRVLLKPVI